MDFSAVLAGLSVAGAVAVIVAGGVLMAAPDFARWLTNKVSGFFSDAPEEDDEDGDQDADWRLDPCQCCQEEFLPVQLADGYCSGCYPHGEDE